MTAPTQAGLPLVVEIVGVAGAGKSTLTKAICGLDGSFRLDEPLQMRKAGHLPSVVWALPRLFPLFGQWIRARRFPSWADFKLVVYLMVWAQRMRRQPEYVRRATVLDHGPVFALARLGHLVRPIPGTEPTSRWWSATVLTWASALDAIIWLDAPNAVLWERVNQRSQDHEIKGGSMRAGTDFFDRFRANYDDVVAAIAGSKDGPIVMRYDTSRAAVAEIATDALSRLPIAST